VSDEGGRMKGVLGVKNETDTVGRLLERSIYELMPDISYAGYTCVPHEKMMKLTVVHPVPDRDEIGPIVARAVKHAYGIFSQIQRGIRARA
jgi:DNA-directed RNA polymerase subunit L